MLDDRFFVAVETHPILEHAPTAWLIDSVSGGHAELTWRDEPTTLNSREQALVISDGHGQRRDARTSSRRRRRSHRLGAAFLPESSTVVTARFGRWPSPTTRRPIFRSCSPERAGSGSEQHPHGDDLGLAYSDDGGETWTEVAFPAQLRANSDELEQVASVGDVLLSIAADGDRIAVTDAWSSDERDVYISGDAGLSWSTVPLTVTVEDVTGPPTQNNY